MIKIRKYQNKDQKQVFEIVKDLNSDMPEDKLEDIKDIKKFYFQNQGSFFIAEDKNKIIGTIGIEQEGKIKARIKRLYILEEYRRKGIAQKLLDKAINFCKKNKYKKVILTTLYNLKPALNFYKKNNFIIYKKDEFIHLKRDIES